MGALVIRGGRDLQALAQRGVIRSAGTTVTFSIGRDLGRTSFILIDIPSNLYLGRLISETVAVTGAAGLIGSRLASHLAAEGHSVVAIDNLSRSNWETLLRLMPSRSQIVEKTLDLASASREQLTKLLRGGSVLISAAFRADRLPRRRERADPTLT